MLTVDSTGFYNKIENHEWIMTIGNEMVDHYNFLLTLPWNDGWSEQTFENELKQHRFYEV